MIHRFEAFLTGITVCYKYLQRIKNAEMTEFGLKGTHAACLFFLNHQPEGLTAAQLCSLCAEDKASISRTLSDLRSRGYLLDDGEKNYRKALVLSPQGREVAEKMDPLIESWVGIGGDGLSEQERETFYRILDRIAQNLRCGLEQSEV